MNYLKAEHLKFKRTISNKLLFIAPFLTALFAWIIGGFFWFPYITFFLGGGVFFSRTICILCFLSPPKKKKAGKDFFFFSVPFTL